MMTKEEYTEFFQLQNLEEGALQKSYEDYQKYFEQSSQQNIFEAKKQEFVQALDFFIQEQINAYNEAKNTVFEDIKSVALYATQPKQRVHTNFCRWLWGYKDDVFDYTGAELVKIKQAKRQMPQTKEELLKEIKAKYPLRTSEFIGD